MSTTVTASITTILPGYDEYSNSQKLSGWTSPSSIPTKLLSGDPVTILFATIITFSLPVLLHIYYFYTLPRRTTKLSTPTFLLVGSSNSGKTALVAQLQQRSLSEGSDAEDSKVVNGVKTHHTQHSYTTVLKLPRETPLGTNKYRSENDPEVLRANKSSAEYILIDTPGHGKLRSDHALSHLNISKTKPLPTGIVFMIDSTSLDPIDSQASQDTLMYLHDTLLKCQLSRKSTSKRDSNDLPVLIAANKQDLFTALPEKQVRKVLELELERVRQSRRKGISSVDKKEEEDDDEAVLGGGGEMFSFKELEEEYGVSVDVLGGSVRSDDGGRGTGKWEAWIGSCL
ncbi:hypothetical protein BT93_L0044 [Corymbia citriodora subsp. variegata]|uniref:Signal recognition particle receptor subunit beta n=1 Tax=Corymbia citriodora subsp. variegata TaxID=360336 RepID=A0A8T0CEU1_CORYI|nr:hypothetical protein BT93_L0044 [Corymbia citriodora subsp. variegata]